jgi:hypothetical protein
MTAAHLERRVTSIPYRKESAMNRRSYIPFIITSVVLFVAGLALGAGKSSEDTSAANTASKLLLTIGLLAVVVTTALELISRARARRAAAGGHAREV